MELTVLEKPPTFAAPKATSSCFASWQKPLLVCHLANCHGFQEAYNSNHQCRHNEIWSVAIKARQQENKAIAFTVVNQPHRIDSSLSIDVAPDPSKNGAKHRGQISAHLHGFESTGVLVLREEPANEALGALGFIPSLLPLLEEGQHCQKREAKQCNCCISLWKVFAQVICSLPPVTVLVSLDVDAKDVPRLQRNSWLRLDLSTN